MIWPSRPRNVDHGSRSGTRSALVNSVAPGVVDTDLWARNKTVHGVVEAI